MGLDERDTVSFVTCGTAGNILGLKVGTSHPVHSLVAAQSAHVTCNTAGAVERMLGCKTHLTPAEKVTPEALDSIASTCSESPEFYTIPRAVTLTLATELGEVYSVEELQALREVAEQHNMLVHIDGARLSNACVALAGEGVPEEMLRRVVALADVVTFGGAKNGLGTAEAVVVKRSAVENPNVVRAASKQMGMVVSKARFVSSQFIAFFSEGLWVRNARHANAMARALQARLSGIPEIDAPLPVTNQLFVTMPEGRFAQLGARYHVYPWSFPGEGLVTCRFVTSWSTTEEEIDGVAQLMQP
eukprot:TRINITY_DN17187_c0_g2_i1.p1 TRINITY_DN17187_c0_g2~~TRINITY_DN17187_c0_g2_i1.p1  ORF type:complete len:352 (+),score=140.09 TRINITY_DN17187_c0_g2_i1:152-1057(+)